MKSTVSLLLLTVAFTFSFSSCSGDDELKDAMVTYPHELKLYQIDQQQIRLFTSKGEISDKKIINSYFNSYDEYIKVSTMRFNDEFVKSPSYQDYYRSVTYHTVDSASMIDYHYVDYQNYREFWLRTDYIISKEKQLLHFTSPDLYTIIPVGDMNKEYLRPIDFAQFSAPIEEIPDNPYYLKQKRKLVAKGNNLHLEIYAYVCRLRRGKMEFSFPIELTFNIFDKDKISLLAPNDTLLILEHTFKYAPEHGLYPIVTGKSGGN